MDKPTPEAPLAVDRKAEHSQDLQLKLFSEIDQNLPRANTDGQDDMNLVELLLGVVRAQRIKPGETIQTPWEKGERSYDVEITDRSYRIEWEAVVTEKGQKLRKTFYLAVNSGTGLPTAYVEDVLVALLKLSSIDKFDESTIRTTRYKLLDMMQWPGKSKHYYDRLEETLDHMASMSVQTNSLWNPATRTYWKFTFNLLDSSALDLGDDTPNAQIAITWAPTALKLLKMGYAKPLDTEFFYSLGDQTSKRLYRWLDKQFRLQSRVEIDVLYLAHRVLGYGISWRYPSKVTQKLKPKLETLAERGFCTWDVQKSSTDSRKKFVFERVTPYTSVVHPATSNIREALIQRGFAPQEASNLIGKHGAWNCLRQLEHHDYKRADGADIANSKSWIKSAVGYKSGTGYALPKPLADNLRSAGKKTSKWCAGIYDALTGEEQRHLNETAMLELDGPAKQQLKKKTPDAVARFNRIRNRLLINSSDFPPAGDTHVQTSAEE